MYYYIYLQLVLLRWQAKPGDGNVTVPVDGRKGDRGTGGDYRLGVGRWGQVPVVWCVGRLPSFRAFLEIPACLCAHAVTMCMLSQCVVSEITLLRMDIAMQPAVVCLCDGLDDFYSSCLPARLCALPAP